MGSSPKRMKAFNISCFNSVPLQPLTCLSLPPGDYDKGSITLALTQNQPSICTFDLTILPPLGSYFLNYSQHVGHKMNNKPSFQPFTHSSYHRIPFL